MPVRFPYWHMNNEDLFALFTPASQLQAPSLREAIISLRLLAALGEEVPGGLEIAEDGGLVKAKQRKRPFVEAVRTHREQVESARGSCFDVGLLVTQLRNECVWSSDFDDAARWGAKDDRTLGMIVSLVLRVESFISDSRFGCVFDSSSDAPTLEATVDEFLASEEARILHVDLSTVPTERHFKQIVVNALARRLLDRARGGSFESVPLIAFVDEAHQFLGRVPHLDDFGLALDGLELIAKEGRKYGLHLVLATQRPRDLTRAVLSQIGCVVVHRLTEPEDLEILGSAAGRRDVGAAAYVPTLAPGHCLVQGVALPFPVVVNVHPPSSIPAFSGSEFSLLWQRSGLAQD